MPCVLAVGWDQLAEKEASHCALITLLDTGQPEKHRTRPELENVKSFTWTNIDKPAFTPRKARKSWHFRHFKPTKQNLWGFLWWINVNKSSIYCSLSIDLNFCCRYLPKNGLFLLIILASQTFYPNWPIFSHGCIRHIRDIFQLWTSHWRESRSCEKNRE